MITDEESDNDMTMWVIRTMLCGYSHGICKVFAAEDKSHVDPAVTLIYPLYLLCSKWQRQETFKLKDFSHPFCDYDDCRVGWRWYCIILRK